MLGLNLNHVSKRGPRRINSIKLVLLISRKEKRGFVLFFKISGFINYIWIRWNCRIYPCLRLTEFHGKIMNHFSMTHFRSCQFESKESAPGRFHGFIHQHSVSKNLDCTKAQDFETEFGSGLIEKDHGKIFHFATKKKAPNLSSVIHEYCAFKPLV